MTRRNFLAFTYAGKVSCTKLFGETFLVSVTLPIQRFLSKDVFSDTIWNKTVVENKAGKYKSHFFQGLKGLMSEAVVAQYPLRMVSGNICCDYKGDILELISFKPVSGTNRFEVNPRFKNLLRIGIEQQTVETMAAKAATAAQEE